MAIFECRRMIAMPEGTAHNLSSPTSGVGMITATSVRRATEWSWAVGVIALLEVLAEK